MVGLGGGVRRGVVGGDDGGERSGVSSCRRNGRRLSSSTGTRRGVLEGNENGKTYIVVAVRWEELV